MGVAKSIEQRLEGLVEGFFTKAFRSGLQPVEVGRRILREMGDGRTVSVNKVYAPNEFRIVIGAEDYARFSQMEEGLQREFSDLVIEEAKRNRWNLMGLPQIRFKEDDGMGKGEFRVEATFATAKNERQRVSTREPLDGDPTSTGAISSVTAERMGIADSAPQLLVVGDDGRPAEKISLTRDPVVIGRISSADVVLSDPNVSRRHAELRREDGGWAVVDLGSTNGTTVNGEAVQHHPLSDGDRLGFGTSELIFNEARG